MSTPELPLTMPREGAAQGNERETSSCAKADDEGSHEQTPSDWLGIETDHRRLLEAGQAEWLHPPSAGLSLGRGCFVSDLGQAATPNAIRVRLVFDAKKLPLFDTARSDSGPIVEGSESETETVVGWLAPMPLYAVTRMEVSSCEEKTRLLALVREFSNVTLPEVGLDVGNTKAIDVPSRSSGKSNLELPDSLDAIQGAMAMAAWAVPRVEPWIEALQWALNHDADRARRQVAGLAASWLRFPWCDDLAPSMDDWKAGLWSAAISTLRSPKSSGKSPAHLADDIAKSACSGRACEATEEWLGRTRRIIAAEETIGPGEEDAGLAIQLVLLRPEPMEFKTWSHDLPWLPPGIWWAAAVLCGWRHGYRALDKRFKGGAVLREFLATRALSASWVNRGETLLPTLQRASLKRWGEEDFFSLSWGERTVLRKRWQARAKWYRADLSDKVVGKAARDLASELGWRCFTQHVRLRAGRIPVTGEGDVRVNDHGDLVVEGTVEMELPAEAQLVEELDEIEFRRALASEAGTVCDPPAQRLGEEEIPGLIYRRDFIDMDEERRLVDLIDRCEWSRQLKRRVQQYGWRYDYRQREIDASMRLGDLPAWAADLGQRLVDAGLLSELPDQLIVNEYEGSQGIRPHIDHRGFSEQVATISLLESWMMVFRLRHTKRKVGKSLERRSVAVLTGDARYKWTHEIPGRKYERVGEGHIRTRRGRRISLTFRRVKGADGALLTASGEAAV